jgi:hypothetical protein
MTNSVPAGWYPTPDGKQRYWDGEQWTNLPWDEEPASVAPAETPIPPKKRSKRKLITAGAIVLVVGALVAGGIIWKTTNDAQAAADAQQAAEVAEEKVKAKEADQKRRDSAERAEREVMVEQIESNITTMAEKHVADDLIDGPIIDVSCSPLGGGSTDDLTEQTTVFDCFVANKDNGDGTMSGYKYHATMNWSSGEFTYGMGAA